MIFGDINGTATDVNLVYHREIQKLHLNANTFSVVFHFARDEILDLFGLGSSASSKRRGLEQQRSVTTRIDFGSGHEVSNVSNLNSRHNDSRFQRKIVLESDMMASTVTKRKHGDMSSLEVLFEHWPQMEEKDHIQLDTTPPCIFVGETALEKHYRTYPITTPSTSPISKGISHDDNIEETDNGSSSSNSDRTNNSVGNESPGYLQSNAGTRFRSHTTRDPRICALRDPKIDKETQRKVMTEKIARLKLEILLREREKVAADVAAAILLKEKEEMSLRTQKEADRKSVV